MAHISYTDGLHGLAVRGIFGKWTKLRGFLGEQEPAAEWPWEHRRG